MHLRFFIIAACSSALAAAQSLTDLLGRSDQFSGLHGLLQSDQDLLRELSQASNVTVIVPSNTAISELLSTDIGRRLQGNAGLIRPFLRYHVLNGTYYTSNFTQQAAFPMTMLSNDSYSDVTGGQRVVARVVENNVTFFSGLLTRSTVIEPNVNFTGGVVQVVNQVLVPPMNVSDTAIATNLTSFEGALQVTNSVNTVNGIRDVTVFAPNNEAFHEIGRAAQSLTMDDLKSLLQYHVINGTLGYSSAMGNDRKLQTLSGQEITVRIENGNMFVNNAQVVVPDVLVANGVVHILDQVLNPNSTSTTRGPSVPDATGTDTPFTSGVPAPTSSVATPTAAAIPSSTGLAAPMMTGGIGMAALFGAGAAMMNY